MRHNDVRDQFASYLRKVAHDVVVEPPLQPLVNGSLFSPRPRRNLLAWMLLPAVSWEEGSSDRSWTFEFSTRMLPPTPRCPYPPCTSGTRQKSSGGMKHVSMMSSMPHLCPLSSVWQSCCGLDEKNWFYVVWKKEMSLSQWSWLVCDAASPKPQSSSSKSPPGPSAEVAIVECKLAL